MKPNDLSSSTPFVIIDAGTPFFIAFLLPQCATEVVDLFDREDTTDALASIRDQSAETAYRLGEATPSQVWLWYLLVYLTQQPQNAPAIKDRLTMLKFMLITPPEDAWRDLRNFIAQGADNLTGWSSSTEKIFAEKDKVFRSDDDQYYQLDRAKGDLYRVAGAKTARETRLDYITNQVLRSYGNLRQVIELFSLFAIGHDFAQNPQSYHLSLKAALVEPRWQTLGHQWTWRSWIHARTMPWRPSSNLCDPAWLAADLTAHLTDAFVDDNWHRPVVLEAETHRGFDTKYNRQMDCVLTSSLTIGDGEEHHFEFAGRQYRWINGSPEAAAIVSVAMTPNDDPTQVEGELNHLLTLLSWDHNVPLSRQPGASVIGPVRRAPAITGIRLTGGVLIRPEMLFRIRPNSLSPVEWRAMAYFREAIGSQSVFYQFLNFWKIIDVAFPNKTRNAWIDATVGQLAHETKRIAEIRDSNRSVARYLQKSNRDAIVHVHEKPYIDPDVADDYRRLANDIGLVKILAKLAIESLTQGASLQPSRTNKAPPPPHAPDSYS